MEYPKIRLICTYDCPRNCEGCCNKDWKYDPPIILSPKEIENILKEGKTEELILTGGEPLLYPNFLSSHITNYKRISPETKIILYTSLPSAIHKNYLFLCRMIDGLTLTLHGNDQLEDFYHLNDFILTTYPSGLNLRLNVFKEVVINENINLSLWEVKEIEWIKDCPLPDNEVLCELKTLWSIF